MPVTEKQSNRATLKDDALNAIDRINHIVSDDLWEELDRFGSSRSSTEIADLHEVLQPDADVLLVKIFRSFYSSNAAFLLRSAPEATRLAALIRLRLTVLKLEGIVKNTQTLDRSSAMLFFYLFSDSPDTLQAIFAKELAESVVCR